MNESKKKHTKQNDNQIKNNKFKLALYIHMAGRLKMFSFVCGGC
jgi:hypothetical protein